MGQTQTDSLHFPWDEERLKAHLKQLTAEEHVMGSPRQKELANYLAAQARELGLEASLDSFTVQVPDPSVSSQSSPLQIPSLDLTLTNVYARLPKAGSSCAILLASHYDSKRLEEGPSVGANDGGSSSAALMEIMRSLRQLKPERLPCSVLALWFDGEEAYLHGWQDGEKLHPLRSVDHLYGSRHLAGRLLICKKGPQRCLPEPLGGEAIRAMLLLDMIGMPGARLSRDLNSDPGLLRRAISIDEASFGARFYGSSRLIPIDDDHIPFAALGIPTLDLIDFENIDDWHSNRDRLETLSLESIRDISFLTMQLLLTLGS